MTEELLFLLLFSSWFPVCCVLQPLYVGSLWGETKESGRRLHTCTYWFGTLLWGPKETFLITSYEMYIRSLGLTILKFASEFSLLVALAFSMFDTVRLN